MRDPIDDGGFAYPSGTQQIGEHAHDPMYAGMTIRDHFAGLAMQGIISKCKYKKAKVNNGSQRELKIARGAYSYADAMIEARKEQS